jgi:hypothetical protein
MPHMLFRLFSLLTLMKVEQLKLSSNQRIKVIQRSFALDLPKTSNTVCAATKIRPSICCTDSTLSIDREICLAAWQPIYRHQHHHHFEPQLTVKCCTTNPFSLAYQGRALRSSTKPLL